MSFEKLDKKKGAEIVKISNPLIYMAVGQGFEPREGCPSTVFKTAAFDHSASPPKRPAYYPIE